MGITRKGAQVDFWPDDDEKTMYIPAGLGLSLTELLDKIDLKWPGQLMDTMSISAENIHTSCLTYDMHCPGDYTDFIVVELKG